jgi:hypothetical protein
MTARRVAMLLVAGFVVIGFAIWLSSTRHLDRATLTGDVVLPGMEAAVNSVSEVRLTKADGTRTTLKKGASDWTVGERDYPADSGKVRKLLLDLAALNVVEEKTRNPEYYPQLGVDDVSAPKATGTQVEAVTPTKNYALIIGKASGEKSGYVRVAGAPQSLLAAPFAPVDADPRRWLDHALFDIPQERVKEVLVKPADSAGYTVTRANKEQTDFTVTGIPKGRELSNPTAANSIPGSLGQFALDDVRHASAVAPGAPAPAALAHATFRTFDGLELEFVGHKDGVKTLVSVTPRSTAKESQGEAQKLETQLKDWEFEIPSYKYDGLFRPLEDLLQKLPEKPPSAKDAAKAKGAAKASKLPPAPGASDAGPPSSPQE